MVSLHQTGKCDTKTLEMCSVVHHWKGDQDINVCETTEWITRHNSRHDVGHKKKTVTECSTTCSVFITRNKTENFVTYIVGEVDDLIVVDISKKNFMKCLQTDHGMFRESQNCRVKKKL